MSHRKRSAAGRNRISIDVGDMKPELKADAKRFGITLSDHIRNAIHHYYRPEDGGVSGLNIGELLLCLYNFETAHQISSRNPADPLAKKDSQQAFDLLIWEAEFFKRKNSG